MRRTCGLGSGLGSGIDSDIGVGICGCTGGCIGGRTDRNLCTSSQRGNLGTGSIGNLGTGNTDRNLCTGGGTNGNLYNGGDTNDNLGTGSQKDNFGNHNYNLDLLWCMHIHLGHNYCNLVLVYIEDWNSAHYSILV